MKVEIYQPDDEANDRKTGEISLTNGELTATDGIASKILNEWTPLGAKAVPVAFLRSLSRLYHGTYLRVSDVMP